MEKVREIRASPDQTKINRTIFAGILGSSLPDEEKTDMRLASESQLVIFAGEGTVGKGLVNETLKMENTRRQADHIMPN